MLQGKRRDGYGVCVILTEGEYTEHLIEDQIATWYNSA